MEHYDLTIIGSGPGGYVTAIRGAQLGLKVALIEKDEIGGTCLNRGCIPTKSILHSAELYREMKNCERFGIHAEKVGFDIQKIFDRKNEVVDVLRKGIDQLLHLNEVHCYYGKASITSSDTVEIVGREETILLKTGAIVIATGSYPAVPPIPGSDLKGVLNSDMLLGMNGKSFRHLVIIGGGVIGVEFASIYRDLDCEVTVIEALDRILPLMDKEISQNLTMIMKKRGISIYTSSFVEKIEKGDRLKCTFLSNDSEQTVEADGILVAVGRKANIDCFDDTVKIKTEKGFIATDSNFETSIKNIYAIGDVNGKTQLAHAASAQGIAVAEHIAGLQESVQLPVIPICVYVNPEIASVGMTAEDAKKAGIAVSTGKFIMSANGKSQIEDQDRGFVKTIFEQDSGRLLGAQLMCSRATDLISEFATAITNNLTRDQLAAVIRPHPTFSEAITEAVENAGGVAVHIAPPRKR